MRDALESRLGCRIPEDSPLIEWLLEHACGMMNRFSINLDGRTAYENWKGKKYTRELPECGERVMFKVLDKKHKDKGNVRWKEGHSVGIMDYGWIK